MHRTLYKTELCPLVNTPAGCPRRFCKFAHSESELQVSPDLTKTRICLTWVATGACCALGCRFAHGRHELRPLHPSAFTSLCGFYSAQKPCRRGLDCHYAHGEQELRPFPTEITSPQPYKGEKSVCVGVGEGCEKAEREVSPHTHIHTLSS
eukprot:GDKI01003263.1.p1 GENE.GDKI01003263.1~~GDKI01003263.1.p1  ORF type:complete len:151 (+),score=28.69 GDKI01003263.1:130-582(+)